MSNCKPALCVPVVGMPTALDGPIIANPYRTVAPVHRLAVRTWCLGMTSSLLDTYVDAASGGSL